MKLDEFSLINYFAERQSICRDDVLVGSGDDAAIVSLSPEHELAMSMDTLVSGVHFPEDTLPEDIAYKSVAVNLSDLAAMGAEPTWMTTALTFPSIDEAWLVRFCDGFFDALEAYGVQLIGGDLTRGPFTITCQSHGVLPKGTRLCRSTAEVGDKVFVTGTLGGAALGLQALKNNIQLSEPDLSACVSSLNRPVPRVKEGLALRNVAHAAIDISDGLLADLTHILNASGVGATIQIDNLPIAAPLISALDKEQATGLALTGGDDYELCFTAPVDYQGPETCIGIIDAEPGLRLQNNAGDPFLLNESGYRHFS